MSIIKKFIFLIIILFVAPLCVYADMGPRTFNKGGAIYSIENTEVEMIYEKVIFSNLKMSQLYNRIELNDLVESNDPIVDVDAEFIMQNMGSSTEEMQVFFPFYFNERDESFDFVEEVFDIEVFVNGEIVGYTENAERKEVLFDVVFEPKTKKTVIIKYKNFLSPVSWGAYYKIGYILHTGALWKNSIGEGEIVFEFPYSIEDQANFFYEKEKINDLPNKDCSYGKYCYVNNKVIYKFKELEPTKDDDILYSIFRPSSWQKFLELQDEIAKIPSYEAHIEMAELYNYPFKDFETEYFEEIDKALNIKYPQKDLDYCEEAGKYYSKNWLFFPDGKYYNFYCDLNKVIAIRDDLYDMDDRVGTSTRNKLIDKINFGLFRQTMSEYDYYLYKQKQNEKVDKPNFQSIMGDRFLMNDNFERLIVFLHEEKINDWEDEARNYFFDYKNGDYSFLNEPQEELPDFDNITPEIKKESTVNNVPLEKNVVNISYKRYLFIIPLATYFNSFCFVCCLLYC